MSHLAISLLAMSHLTMSPVAMSHLAISLLAMSHLTMSLLKRMEDSGRADTRDSRNILSDW